jgi:hypothetical protein
MSKGDLGIGKIYYFKILFIFIYLNYLFFAIVGKKKIIYF